MLIEYYSKLENAVEQHNIRAAYDGPQGDGQDLDELDDRNEVRQHRRLSDRLLERLFRFVFILPVFVVDFRRQVDIEANIKP